jgi:hypothetical protein
MMIPTLSAPGPAGQAGIVPVTNVLPPVAEDNQLGVIATHDKPLNASDYTATPYNIIAKATAGLIKATPGNLYRMWVTNDNAALQAYALVNKATLAATGDTPLLYFYVPLKATVLIEWRFGLRFTTGITWAQVTTIGAATITTTTADSLVSAEYR